MTEVIVIGLVAFFWILSLGFAFWTGLRLGKSLYENDADDY